MRNMPQLVSGVVVEQVGDDVLVVVPGTTEALCLSGEAAETVLTIQAGQSVSSSDAVVGELVARGVVEVPGLSRRGLIRAGAVGAGAGIAILALPSVAAASSVVELTAAAFFGRTPPIPEMSTFFNSATGDLYLAIIVDYSVLDVNAPADGTTGTVTFTSTLFQTEEKRTVRYFVDSTLNPDEWVALVAKDNANPQAPGNGTFTLEYSGVRITGNITG